MNRRPREPTLNESMKLQGDHADVTQIAIAVVEHEECFLVGVRTEGAALAGKHEFPGGKVKPGESLDQAARRECREETGLRVEITGTYQSQVETYDHDKVVLHFFAARPTIADTATCPSSPWRWVPRAELKTLDFPTGNRNLLSELLACKPPARLS